MKVTRTFSYNSQPIRYKKDNQLILLFFLTLYNSSNKKSYQKLDTQFKK